MDVLLEAIRAATAPEASTEVKEAGATACRTILIALEAKEGEPLALPVPVSPQVPEVAALVAGRRGVPVDQLLDLAIARLRTMVPADQASQVHRFTIPLVPVPRKS